jgi:hypothetical protein
VAAREAAREEEALVAALVALFGSQGPEVLEAARPALVGALLARGEGGLSRGAGAAWERRTAAERQAAMCRAAREMLDRPGAVAGVA